MISEDDFKSLNEEDEQIKNSSIKIEVNESPREEELPPKPVQVDKKVEKDATEDD